MHDAAVKAPPPRVAVVMTVHNGLPYLPEAVDSILSQSLAAFEFIIVDDGSTDATPDYLDAIDDPRVTVIHQPRQGQQAAAHRAILAAAAPLIARMDSDDVSHPDRLAQQVSFLDAHPEVGLVGSQITRRGEAGSGLRSHFPTDHQRITDDLMHNRHSMCNPATMFRRELYFRVGGYWQHNIAEDWDLFLKIADVAKLANLEQPLLSYRFHTGSINGRRTVEAQLYNEFAAHQAMRRQQGLPADTYATFLANHRSQRFPWSLFFYCDCHSLAQYRKAVAEIHSGRPIWGRLRGLYAILCSPGRMIRRVKSSLGSP
ncbi:MAG: glycosyltransferase family 2 protein [Planctomycetaceae bacterium]